MEWFGRLTRLHVHLQNYTELLLNQYYEAGIPVQRPIFLDFECEQSCRGDKVLQDQYMYGRDMLIAPIYTEGATERTVYFPKGEVWISIWNHEDIIDATSGGISAIKPGKMGEPPVYFRRGSPFETTFSGFTSMRAGQYPSANGFIVLASIYLTTLAVAILANQFSDAM